MRGALLSVIVGSAVARALPAAASDDVMPTLLITDTPPSGCLSQSYYGSYGGKQDQHIYLPSASCLDSVNLMEVSTGSIVPLDGRIEEVKGRMVWIGQAGVEGVDNDIRDDWADIIPTAEIAIAMLRGEIEDEDLTRLFNEKKQAASGTQTGQEQQVVFGDNVRKEAISTPGLTLLHSTTKSVLALVSEDLLPVLDMVLPPHLVPVSLPLSPLPYAPSTPEGEVGATEWKPVPSHYAKYLANLTSNLQFDPKLDEVLSEIQHDQVRRNVRWLTGEAPSGITSRHSFTPGAIKAGHWIKEQVEETGASCQFEPFLPGFAPNIICTYPSSTNSTSKVILSAHYDSRGSWGSVIAPGGDDDGSGSGHLLAVAQAIGRGRVMFEKQVILAFFAGEEQGLLGSHAYAEKLYKANETVLYHVQADMLGYHVPGEPLQLGLPESIHLPEATYLLGNLSHIYAPELLVGRTAACCSDHQSFLSFGFPATAVFERNGPIADPKYHNSGDVSSREGYDFEQIVSIARVTMAGLLTVGGWHKA